MSELRYVERAAVDGQDGIGRQGPAGPGHEHAGVDRGRTGKKVFAERVKEALPAFVSPPSVMVEPIVALTLVVIVSATVLASSVPPCSV